MRDWSQRMVHHLIWWRQLESNRLVDEFDKLIREFAVLKFEALDIEAPAERYWMQWWCHHRRIVHRGVNCEHYYLQYVFSYCWLEAILGYYACSLAEIHFSMKRNYEHHSMEVHEQLEMMLLQTQLLLIGWMHSTWHNSVVLVKFLRSHVSCCLCIYR